MGCWSLLAYANVWVLLKILACQRLVVHCRGPETKENITGGAPSVLISREVAEKGDFTQYLIDNMRKCVEQDICNKNELYMSLTGNKGSPQVCVW